MHTVRHEPTHLQPGRLVRGRKSNTRLPTLNPEEPPCIRLPLKEDGTAWKSLSLARTRGYLF